MKKFENILLIVLTAGLILSFTVAAILLPDEKYSYSERRVLTQLPKLSAETLVSGKFMSQFDDYVTDQFPLRDTFRSLKANISQKIFRQKDNHGLYYSNGHLSKIEYPLSDAQWDGSVKKIKSVYDQYIANTGCRVYSSLIPDKNCFLAPLDGYPVMDYDAIAEKFKKDLGFAEYIDIFPTVSLDSFYFTDQHWRQEAVVETAQALADGLGVTLTDSFTDNRLDKPFYGAYYGQAALNVPADELHYLTSDILDGCTVTSYNSGAAAAGSVYDMDKANGRDPYEMFLCGSDALLTLENPDGDGRELIIFRDSFASSITPLLASGYSKITLVDLRYINSGLLGNFIEFKDQDVLFLYSALIMNSGSIK